MLPFWNLQKMKIFLRTTKATLTGFLKFPKRRQARMKDTCHRITSCKQTVRGNTKERIK